MHLGSIIVRPLHVFPGSFKFSLGFIAIATACLVSTQAYAAQVTQVKNGKVLIDGADSDGLTQGGNYFVLDGSKKVAIVQITQVKGSKALAKVMKGTPTVNGTLVPYAKGGKTASSGKGRKSKSGGATSDLTIGALLGYSMQSQSVKPASGSTVAMSGSGISLKAFGDMPVSGQLGAIGRAGFEQFAVKKDSASTKITYLSADLLLRYFFTEGAINPYVAGGIGLYFPMTKSSNILDETKISSTSVFLLDAGLNYTISDTLYATGILEYGLFPPSNDVKTTMINVRFGAAMRF
jgi:hypothetical protein